MDGRTSRAALVREQRRRAIFEAALHVFARKGYHGTSITDVVAEAGVARGTFYQYFESKNAIFHELVDELLREIRSVVSGVDTSPDAPPVRDQLELLVTRILETIGQNRELCTIIFKEAVGIDATVDAKLRAFYGELRTYIQASLTLGQGLGFVRPDVDTELAAWCVLGSIREIVAKFVAESAESDLRTVAFRVLDFNLRGVVAT